MLSLWYMYLGYIEYRPNGSKGNVESAKSKEKTDKPSPVVEKPEPPKKVDPPKPPEPKKVEPIKPPEPPKPTPPAKAPELPKQPPPKAPEPSKPSVPEPKKSGAAEDRFLAAERTFGTPSTKPDTKNANVMKNFRITTPETSDDEEMISELVEDSASESDEEIENVKP